LTRSRRFVPGLALVVAALVAVLAWTPGASMAQAQSSAGSGGDAAPTFQADFSTAEDFYERFDYGYTGVNPWEVPDDAVKRSFHGDHNEACEAPTTDREVSFGGDRSNLDFSELFWHCAPGNDPSKGHVMTGVDTFGYNIAWFSPKALFTNTSKVCWDINETQLSGRKWTQVLFVSEEDATRYPAGSDTAAGPAAARGTGGFDLGYTSPDFRADPGPHSGIFPQGGTLAGLKLVMGAPSWFQDQDTWTQRFEGEGYLVTGVTDKAERYTHCLTNEPGNVVRLTQATPTGTRTIDMPGQIPQWPVRVVFQDDNYDSPKDDGYDPKAVTWHWDNVQITAGSSTEVIAPPQTTVPPRTEDDADQALATPAAGDFDGDGGDGPGELVAVGILAAVVLFVGGVALGALLMRDRGPRRSPQPPQD
jgi:hypothetical protein